MKTKRLQNKKVVVGLSGGIDSTVALLLLKKKGYSPSGLTLQLPIWDDPANLNRENICCTVEGIRWIRKFCLDLDVPYYVINCTKAFKKVVVNYFVKIYKEGKTPNPCMICNRFLRFPKLFEFATKQGAEFVATGHYARLRWGNSKSEIRNPKFDLLAAKDKNKDQSYFLAFLSQKELGRLVLPIGDYTKREVYEIAREEGIEFPEERPSSRDFCFVGGELKNSFLKKELGEKQGPILNTKSEILGEHRGLHFYTIGQRRNIGFSGGPFWVISLDKENNALIVSQKEGDLYKKECWVKDIHWISGKEPGFPFKVNVEIRLRHQAAPAVIIQVENRVFKVIFDNVQRSITPGQFAVFYKKEVCLGGGEII